jgi:lysine-ketoglutarate reductase/saccharopine dehydrogenase-like protein (TIGR00300 family)
LSYEEDMDAALAEADRDGVFPEGFYATTNFATEVKLAGEWVKVEGIEMDVGVRVARSGTGTGTGVRVEACPMHRVRKGDAIVVGYDGVRVETRTSTSTSTSTFGFMSSGVSTERPKGRLVAEVADAIRKARAGGGKILFVGGPAIVHAGVAPFLERLVLGGWINVLFAGNALAAHDIEAAMYGTSLGLDLERGICVAHGHEHHLRAINRVRRAGSIAAAVAEGLVAKGVMHACVTKPIPFVLAGSIRDDGPLPDVISDTVAAADAMREHVRGVTVAIIVATTLHGIATGNMLGADVATFCVDTDAETVIKLIDRGTHHAVGIVTDCEYFLGELSRLL